MKLFSVLYSLLFLSSVAVAEDHAYTVIKGKTREFHTGLIHAPEGKGITKKTYMALKDCDDLPEAFDLRPLGVVPEVRDQGNCGSCWSFSKTASLESALLVAGRPAVDLSEQELVSCDKEQYGCSGGFLSGFEYQIKHGQGLEKDFAYKASNARCKAVTPQAKGKDFTFVGAEGRAPTEKELKCALYKSHTVPWITVSASSAWGSPPSSERTVYSRCGRGQTNHAVGVVGWFKSGTKTAFIMKNSWGKSWGDKGYMSLPLGCDSFGDEVAFVTAM